MLIDKREFIIYKPKVVNKWKGFRKLKTIKL